MKSKMKSKMLWSWALAIGLVTPGACASAPTSPASGAVAIMDKPDGSKQCEPQLPILSLESARAELEKSGLDSRSLVHLPTDGKMRMQVCGSPTGAIFRVQVQRGQVEKARALGYREIVR